MPKLPWYSNADAPLQPGHGLGRRVSKTATSFPRMAARAPHGVTAVNKRLDLPTSYRDNYDQGNEGSCVGFAWSWAMSIFNRRLYAARKLYLEAQYLDPWPETPPEEGTSVEAGAHVLRDQGHWRLVKGIMWPVALAEGISSFASAMTVDELRTAISMGSPFVLGINWYSNFDSPKWLDPGAGGKRWWIGVDDAGVPTQNLGSIRGGHAICGFGARDDIQAIVLVNSWGYDYPIVQMPYSVVERLIREDGESLVPVDRP